MTQSRRQPPTPDALTAALGQRLPELRQAAGIRSQSELGKRMTAHGVPWSRVSVEKLENGRRGAITGQELLALALVLDVPLAALLVSPTTSSVPIADGVEPDPWHALVWLLGREPLQGEGRWRNQAGLLVEAAHEAFDALRALEESERNPTWTSPGMPMGLRAELLAKNREQHLRKLSEPLAVLAEQGVRVPLPDYVRRHADDLGVDLPGAEG